MWGRRIVQSHQFVFNSHYIYFFHFFKIPTHPPPPSPYYYFVIKMANVFSTLAKGKKPLSGILVISLIYAVHKARQQFKSKIPSSQQQPSKKKHKKVGVNAEFLEQMKKLLPICVPGNKL